MPQVPMQYLVGFLIDAGVVMQGGFGPVPLSHSELRAWQGNTGIELQPWETKMIRRLSGVYLKESSIAEKDGAPAPYAPTDAVALADVAERMRKSMRGMAK